MNIASTPFLFLFLPLVIGVYYLIPRKQGLQYRNIFLLLASLFFYTWGEPVYVFLLGAMVLMTCGFGRMAYGNKGTAIGKTAVFMTVVINLTTVILLSKLAEEFPIGFSFFLFSSISYVVDIYRGHCKTRASLLQTALYTSVFFKILQGPIISYRRFEDQIAEREESFDQVAEGIWRFAIGLSKKVIIANNLSYLVNAILGLDLAALSAGDAWIGCIAYLVYLYFDLSGYADMAIGLAKAFGFNMPENFNYPYISKSVTEFWRRWHITLCVWFTEYLYYPILLGPSVRLRKYLLRHNVNPKVAKTIQNILVPTCVWLATALWHGMNLNYAIWGILNCGAILIEPHIKALKNERANSVVRHAGMLAFLFISMPLISLGTFKEALMFYKAMFAGTLGGLSAYTYYGLQNYGVFLIIGIIGCVPVVPFVKGKVIAMADGKYQKLWNIAAFAVMAILVVACVYYLFTSATLGFLYQQ